MSDTFERKNRNEKLETYEWDDIWFEQANSECRNRVLYIGDSISCGMRKIATKMADGKYLFDGLGTSKAIDNPYYKELISLVARQQKERRIVLFNNGLHGFHLNCEQYSEYYEEMVRFLMEVFSREQIMILLTTAVTCLDNSIVIERNKAVSTIAGKYSLPIVDLYSVSFENIDKLRDGVHMTEEGYAILVRVLLEEIDEMQRGREE